MKKAIFLAAAAVAATPALAQDVSSPGAVPQQEIVPADPQPSVDPTQETPPAPEAAQPVTEAAQTAEPAAQPAQTAEATPSEAQPAATQEQVAAVVGKEFPAYDKDASGALDKAEFGEWMVALRKAAEPGFQPGTPEAVAWNDAAFSQADIDKNASVSTTELTVFLTPKQG